MQFHEVANLFPLMDGDEYAALVADIDANGLREPIWTYKNKIIDGRNRFRACQDLKIIPRFREWNGQESLTAFVLSLNLHRRHLTSSQAAVVGMEAESFFAAEAKQRQGTRNDIVERFPPSEHGKARDQAAAAAGTNAHYITDAKKLKQEAPELLEQVRAGNLTLPQAKRELKDREREVRRDENRQKIAAVPTVVEAVQAGARFSTIVIDPPWEMEKIERDERPRQVGFEYPTMNEDQLKAFPLAEFAADDCHLYLWTTHKHLPMAFRLAEHWGFKYECLMTWVKNVGFTPYSWMRSTEHVLFCRKGSLKLERLGMRLDFNAKVREHSRKPDEFYELIKQASPEPRIDIFSRETREGFEQWGNETKKFAGVA